MILDFCKTAAEVDRDQRSDIGDGKAITSNEFVSVQFAIHAFQALISQRPLRLAIFRELLKTTLKDRTDILNRASDRGEQFQFYPAISPLDLGLFANVAS